MNIDDDNVTELNDWRCPACNTDRNSQGIALVSSWAVACHIAGKIRTGDNTHRKWALNIIGDRIFNPEVYNSISSLAGEIETIVINNNQERLNQEKERIQHLIAERDAREAPQISAYRFIELLETSLHEYVCNILQDSYGKDEKDWWVKGIPYPIRKDCAIRRESDQERDELYNYTDLIDLKSIIEKNIRLFVASFRRLREDGIPQGEFLSNLTKSNVIRRKVMHTIRSSITSNEVTFLQQYCEIINKFIESE